MINLSLNVPASKPCGGVVLTRSSLLYGILLAVAGISQTLASTPGDTPAEDAGPAWRAVTSCGLMEGGPRRDTHAAPLSLYDVYSPSVLSLPTMDKGYEYIRYPDSYSLTTVDWTKPFEVHMSSVHTSETPRLKFEYVTTTNLTPTIGVRLSF
jgi:hypothetical protein